MKKIIFFLLLLNPFLCADWLLNTSYICVTDFYVIPSTGTLYYKRSDNNVTYSTTSKSLIDDLINGYEYNVSSNRCQPIAVNNPLRMDNKDFTFLMGLTGLLIGFSFLFGLFTIFSRRS